MLDICINTIFFSTDHCVCSHFSWENSIFRIILEVTSCKCISVCIHRWCIPSGYFHFVCHLTNALTEGKCKVFVPGICDHNCGRESNGACSCKVVVDRCRSVTVNGHNFSYTWCCRCLISAKCDHCIHIRNSQLVKKCIPFFIIIGKTTHISKCHSVFRTCCRHFIRIIVVIVWIIIAVV